MRGFTGSAIGTGFPIISIPTSSTGGFGPSSGDFFYYDKPARSPRLPESTAAILTNSAANSRSISLPA